ncbi:MAG: RHS repeat protein [Acidobacteria bacterium]|nr:RHS repeat protein [Acidobacteriota bacterium]
MIETTDELGQVRRVEREIGTNLPMATIGANGAMENQQVYDSRGNTTEMTDELGHSNRMEYEPVFNNPTKMVDKLGHETRMEYDERGNQTAMINALGEITRWEYDQFGQVVSMTDGLGHTSRMEYDQYGNVIAQVDPLGNRTTFEFNQLGWQQVVVDPEDRRKEVTFDKIGRVIIYKDSNNTEMQFTYNENDLLISRTDALNRTWRMEYDIKNRLVKEIDPLGREIQSEFNLKDEQISVVSPSGRTTRYTYDLRGSKETITDPEGNTVQYIYNTDQHLMAVIDQRGNSVRFNHDDLNRLSGIIDPLGKVTWMEYDVQGNKTLEVDRLGRRTVLEYDLLNRPSKIMYPDAEVLWIYDAAGRQTNVTDTQGGHIVWNYDDANRLISEITQVEGVTYQYNKAGDRTRLTVPGQAPITYEYDSAGRVQILRQGADTFTFAYDVLSRTMSFNRPNGVRTSYIYDEVDRLKRITHTDVQNQPIEDFQFAYTLDDEIAAWTSLFSPIGLPEEKTLSPADAANRIQQSGLPRFDFDMLGQPITKTDLTGTTRYEWNSRSRLTKVTLSNGQQVEYRYDALGRRIERTVGSTSTKFVYDGQDVVQDQVNGNPVNYLNGLGMDQKLSQSSTHGKFFLIPDHLGSTVALTDTSGKTLEQMSYEAFGQSTDNNQLTRYLYTGREEDHLTKLIYYRARWYDPYQGRFLTEDFLKYKGGTNLNLYLYVSNSAINLVDPLGLEERWPHLRNCIGYALGAGCAVAPSGGYESLEQWLWWNYGYRCHFTRPKESCNCLCGAKGRFLLYIYKYFGKGHPFYDKWDYGYDNPNIPDSSDYHAIKATFPTGHTTWSYLKNAQPSEFPKLTPNPYDPDSLWFEWGFKEVPRQRYCCCKYK